MTSNTGGQDWTLALDQGGHATRALVFDESGDTVAECVVEIGICHPSPGWVEHDAVKLIESVGECLEQIAAQLGTRTTKVGSAALCTQRSSIVCWSKKTGDPLSAIISWQDTRAAENLRGLSLSDSEVTEITGLPRSPHYGASKLRWCLDHLADVQSARQQNDLAFGPLASFILFNLSQGKTFAVDPANASRTLLWDIHTGNWSSRLLNAFEIDQQLLPAIKPNRHDWCDLQLGDTTVPLTVVTGDQSAVPFAFSDQPVDRLFLNLGTGAFLQRPIREYQSCEGLLSSVLLRDNDNSMFALEGTINGAGAALSWFADTQQIDEDELFGLLPDWLASIEDPPLFINAIGGLAAPFWVSDAESMFIGDGGTGEQAVAVTESIAFLIKANLQSMENCMPDVKKIIASGGLAELDGLLQRVADLSGVSVLRSTNLQATAYGGARLANPALPTLTMETQFAPNANNAIAINKRYQEWRKHLEKAIDKKKAGTQK
ncbi:MAG: FGGY family carbohydrate kinase [Gammaproteobacteria bacterium]|nr:FGGY family carbohydrate kinase [Gammaproteobacteria bacterium]